MSNFVPGCVRFRKDWHFVLEAGIPIGYKGSPPRSKEMMLMRKMSKAFIILFVMATVAIPLIPAVADESGQGRQEIDVKVDHATVQDEVNANLSSRSNTRKESPLCQTVSLNGLRSDVRGCEKNPQWSIIKW
ncbi:MAG: hypothetical protein ACE5MK_11145 [Acidobacteriota bacterium]